MKTFHRIAFAAALALATTFALAADPTELSEGEIRKIDKETRRLTIKHGPLKNLDMPAMTMIFPVDDPALLDKVQAGDKVRFVAEMVNGRLAVTRIEAER